MKFIIQLRRLYASTRRRIAGWCEWCGDFAYYAKEYRSLSKAKELADSTIKISKWR